MYGYNYCMFKFQPTLPVRGVTNSETAWENQYRFQPTLPVRGVTDYSAREMRYNAISTHTPRAGSDKLILILLYVSVDFNPHSPCGE